MPSPPKPRIPKVKSFATCLDAKSPSESTEWRATRSTPVDEEGNEPAHFERLSPNFWTQSDRERQRRCRQRHDNSQRVEIERAPSWHGVASALQTSPKWLIYFRIQTVRVKFNHHEGERTYDPHARNGSLPSYNLRLAFHGRSKRISRSRKDFAFARLEAFRRVRDNRQK